MKLTPEQRKELGRLIQLKVPRFPACAFCGNATGYTIAGQAIYPDATGPFVVLSCNQCGHTLLFSAKTLGLDIAAP